MSSETKVNAKIPTADSRSGDGSDFARQMAQHFRDNFNRMNEITRQGNEIRDESLRVTTVERTRVGNRG